MKRNRYLSVLTSAVLSLTALTALPQTVAAGDYVPEKRRVSVHDPSIVRDEKTLTFYIFGSHIEAAKSDDLQNWNSFANGYAKTNNKLFGILSDNLKKAFAWAGEDLGDCENGFAVWAPDVIWNPDYRNGDGSKGAYLMYFCTSSDYRTSVIAYAAAQNIEGPYTFVDTLVYSGFTDTTVNWGNARKTVNRRYSNTNIQQLIDSGEVTFNTQWFSNHEFNNKLYPNAIDPTVYTDTNGRMYMCYGSWSGGIFTLELDKETGKCIRPKTGTTSDGRMVDSYFGTKISGGYGKSGEGPFIEYNEKTGFYYLFVTYGGLTSNGGYNMRVGRSREPLGPFKDAAGRDMVLNSDTDLNSIGLKLMTNYRFSSLPRAYMAGGHNSVYKDSIGEWYLVYHTRFDDGTEYHEVRTHKMLFNDAGWPVVLPYEFSGEFRFKTGFEPASLAGEYEFINHGTGTDGKITSAEKITLNRDGTISGAVSGTWKESADSSSVRLRIGNNVYSGFFFPQYDETGTGRTVMTFTAAGSSNQSVWGVSTAPWTGTEREVQKEYFGSGQLCYDKNAVTDTSGNVSIGDTDLLSNVPYTITNVNSGLVLESADTNNAKPGTGIQQWAKRGNKSGDANQDFRITDEGNGWCRLTSMQDESLCVAVRQDTAENGAELELQTYTGTDQQLWKLIRSGSYYGIVSKCSGGTAALDVYEWSTENGGAVKQWEFWGGDCQLWTITPTYAAVPARAYTARSGFLSREGSSVVISDSPAEWELRTDHNTGLYYLTDGGENAVTYNEDGSFSMMPFSDGSSGQLFWISCRKDGSYVFDLHRERSYDPPASISAGIYENAYIYIDDISEHFVLAPSKAPIPECIETTDTASETTDMKERLLRGDVDCDGSVKIADAVLLARYLAEDSNVTVTAQGKVNAELNGTDSLTTEDLSCLLQYLAGSREL